MSVNWSKVVQTAKTGLRVAERTAVAAGGAYVVQSIAPTLMASGGANAQAWKAVIAGALLAALHAEAGSLLDALEKWAEKWTSPPVVPPSAGGGNSAS